MAGRGPAPGRNPNSKDPDQRRHRIKPDQPDVIIPDGKKYGRDLPSSREWPAETLAWWETWRTCALASTFIDTDWSFLLDTAVLHAQFWSGNQSVAAELRIRVAKFGATPEDRARLKVEVGDLNGKPAPTRVAHRSSGDRRARLLKAVGDGDGSS